MSQPSRLERRLNTTDAVVLGLGSMIGAGIFAAAGPAAAAAGNGLLIGVVLAGAIAFLNAITMAQLAAIYPESGGTYVYGGRRLGPFWGFLAGWGFVIGKLASCTAMALTFAFYVSPAHARPLAVAAVLGLTMINSRGIRKTSLATKILVAVVLAALSVVCGAALAGGGARFSRITSLSLDHGLHGVLQAGGMMFFAFAGYARIATLGEEVLEPRKTIPRAILLALGLTLLIYLVVMATAVLCVDVTDLARSKSPLALAVESGAYAALSPIVRIGAGVACLGVLLSLMAGISRTVFAMAANGDLPRRFSVVHPELRIPLRAELAVGAVVALIVGLADLRSAIGFSSFAILSYYAIANVAAWRLRPEERRWPRALAAAGFGACAVVALSLPPESVFGGLLLFAVGSVFYFGKKRAA